MVYWSCKQDFVDWNQPMLEFWPCIGKRNQQLVRLGMIRYHPKLKGAIQVSNLSRWYQWSDGGQKIYSWVCQAKFKKTGTFVSMTLSRKCLVKTPRARLIQFMRDAIEYQIAQVRRPGQEVDHCGRGFSELAKEWIAQNGGEDVLCPLVFRDKYIRNGRRRRFHLSDPRLRQSWQQYHKQHAKLQSLTKKEHRALTKKRRKARQQAKRARQKITSGA